ncbi:MULTISPECIES: HAMP domain-containing sensor histidine kinase [unclassified Fusibacter]|uniref:sensor histidine kinase n=1 Tax=unclassified Fusibacter TaxID=2624464 RepID=UPI0013E91A61|nr:MULTISPECIES: HAMP domain-containing sensor histidine kinase [unclassified Fusibacter]MCK8061075.1 HAMP domain-containing histidine kinase [Fusibacter sp. A2]NPE20471.1 HAMP domain-containing histidine kinase [Fusibacter sp. A1]
MQQGLLILAAFKLVLMNSIRALPIYMAVFVCIDEGHTNLVDNLYRTLFTMVSFLCIPVIYAMINMLYHVKYSFGMPAYMMLCVMFLFVKTELKHVKLLSKSIFLALLLMGFQWLDIVPFLSKYGFGHGEVSADVKSIAEVTDSTGVLTFSALVFFVIFTSNALMILKILMDQNRILDAAETQKKMEMQLVEARIQGLKARTYEEQQYLVHDLKSPLTSIQALVSVSEMITVNPKVKEYMSRVSESVEQLNIMISEILNENKRKVILVEELLLGIMSQISSLEGNESVCFKCKCKDAYISVNRVRFSRMIINVVTNSIAALPPHRGRVDIRIHSIGQDIIIEIEDNGTGIEPDLISQIWEKGFSTKDSFGLGLTYIKNVVERHDGLIEMRSIVDQGTTTWIKIPRVEWEVGNEENINYR